MSVLMRRLQEDIIDINCRLKISKFIPYGLEKVIRDNVPEDHFILGVTYEAGDSQICMSGHAKKGESIDEGCSREMSEEVFLEPRYDTKSVSRTKVNYFYCFNIRDLKIKPRKVFDDDDDTSERAIACIHGSEYDIFKYMRKIRSQPYINDTIVGVWAGKKRNVLSTIYSIRKNMHLDHFIH